MKQQNFPPYRSFLDSETYPTRQAPNSQISQAFYGPSPHMNHGEDGIYSTSFYPPPFSVQSPVTLPLQQQQLQLPPNRPSRSIQQQQTSAQSLVRTLETQALNGRINLSEMYLGDEAAKTIAKALQTHTNIQFLDLKGNNLTPNGLIPILDVLKNNFQLKSLSLEWNRICTQDLAGIEALYRFLINSRSLTHLDLRNNKITADAAKILSNVFRSNQTLVAVDLRWNDIGNPGAQSLLAGIMDNRTLISLELGGNNVAEELLIKIQNVLNTNRDKSHLRMRKIFVSNNNNENWDYDNNNPQNNNIMGSSLNQRDLDFRSRTMYNSPDMGGMNNSQPFHSYSTSGQMQQKQAQQQLQQLPVRDGIPYEQEKIIVHLENLVEEERVQSLEIKEQLTCRITELRQSLQTGAMRKEEFQQHIAALQNDNNSLRTDLQRVEQDLRQFEERKKMDIAKNGETAFQKDQLVRARDKQMQEEILRMKEQQSQTMQNVDYDSQKKCDLLLQHLAKIKSRNDDLRFQLGRQDDLFYNTDLTAKEAAIELVEKVKATANHQYQAKNQIMDTRINKLVQEKMEAEHKMKEYISVYTSNKRQNAEKFRQLQKDIYKYKLDNYDIQIRNNDFEAVIKRLDNEKKNKDKLARKLEEELENLKKKIAKREENEKKQKENVDTNHKKAMNLIQQNHEKQRQRINELEKTMQTVHAQNFKLRQDYQRLQDLLQGNVSKAVFEAFAEKKVI